jgi:alpha-glucosidase (family GH31 glycosyl hydrolase)
MGLSGISTWGSDIGGFFALGTRKLTPELLARWVQVGFASGVMRTQRDGLALPEKDRAQVEDPETLPIWRRYAKLRTQLMPYLAAADREYRRSGMPIMRHLALAFPGDAKAAQRDQQFMLGPDLLVAPVLAPGVKEQVAYLPRGRWVDLWRSARYEESDGSLKLGRAQVLEGGGETTLPAPLEELPLLVREGAVIPLLPAETDSLYGWRDDGRRALLAFPRKRTIKLPAGRRFTLQAALRSKPCGVTPLERRAWRYDPRTRVLTASFKRPSRGRSLRLVACKRAGQRR